MWYPYVVCVLGFVGIGKMKKNLQINDDDVIEWQIPPVFNCTRIWNKISFLEPMMMVEFL